MELFALRLQNSAVRTSESGIKRLHNGEAPCWRALSSGHSSTFKEQLKNFTPTINEPAQLNSN